MAGLKHLTILLIVFLSLLVMNGTSMAAKIELRNGQIFFSGEIFEGDGLKFEKLFNSYQRKSRNFKPIDEEFQTINRLPKIKMVHLNSRGGDTSSAFKIGELIKRNGMQTYVANSQCLSSCALIWLAGREKFKHPKGVIGFHQTYNHKTGKLRGNALVGIYLAKIGYSYNTAYFVATAKPKGMKFLSNKTRWDAGISYNEKVIEKTQNGLTKIPLPLFKIDDDKNKQIEKEKRTALVKNAESCRSRTWLGKEQFIGCKIEGTKLSQMNHKTMIGCIEACESDDQCLAWSLDKPVCTLFDKVKAFSNGESDIGLMEPRLQKLKHKIRVSEVISNREIFKVIRRHKIDVKQINRSECKLSQARDVNVYASCNLSGVKLDEYKGLISQEHCSRACLNNKICQAWSYKHKMCSMYYSASIMTGGDYNIGVVNERAVVDAVNK